MKDKKLIELWNTQNEKLEKSLKLNREIILHLTKRKLNETIGKLRLPKLTALFIGIPYVILLGLITFIAYKAEATIVFIGIGLIALLMLGLIGGYIYHLHLIRQIQGTDDIITVQKQIANLKISSYNLTRLALLQIPLWSVCWISLDTLKSSPLVYGGINLIVFLALCYTTYMLFKKLDVKNHKDSQVYNFFFSGGEWDPLIKSSIILEEINQYDH